MSEFEREYAIHWTHTPEELQMRDLAAEYHEQTEAFDRTVCTGPIIRGEIRPIGPREFSLCDQHARELRDSYYRTTVCKLGFTKNQWRRAIGAHRQRLR